MIIFKKYVVFLDIIVLWVLLLGSYAYLVLKMFTVCGVKAGKLEHVRLRDIIKDTWCVTKCAAKNGWRK